MFSLANFLTVQGTTEPYYVWKLLSSRHDVRAFVSSTSAQAHVHGVTILRVPSLLPKSISFNLFVLPHLFKRSTRNADIIYTYRGVISPIILLLFSHNMRWIIDFRAHPTKQDIEFKKHRGNLKLGKRIYYYLIDIIYKASIKHSHLIVSISNEVKRELIEHYGAHEEKIIVVPLGVDINTFKPRGRRPLLESSGLRLVYSGAIALQRGLDDLFRALALLKNKIPVQLLILGRGPGADINYLKRLAATLKIADMIEWKGFVEHAQVPEVLDTCHAGVSPLPALKSYEVSSPAKVVEYMAMELPVIATNILAHRKVIEHKKNGLLVPPQDPTELANAIQILYKDNKLRNLMAQNARATAVRYSWENVLKPLVDKIEELSADK